MKCVHSDYSIDPPPMLIPIEDEIPIKVAHLTSLEPGHQRIISTGLNFLIPEGFYGELSSNNNIS